MLCVVVCCLEFNVYCLFAVDVWSLFICCCLLFVVCCLLIVVCSLKVVVCCSLVSVCC